MRFARILALLSCCCLLPSISAIRAKTYTGWDCCKPACAWQQNLKGVSGAARTCDINNGDLNNPLTAKSGCDAGGTAYLCENYAPVPTADNMSYGFAVMMSTGSCCRCYELTWTSGNARGKKMVVQAINAGTASGNINKDDIVILTPGGGVGDHEDGCKRQYGSSSSWGAKNGGVNNRDDCSRLPQNLQGGCYWRFNWAKGDINGWDIDYKQVTCPDRLPDISGCEPN